MNSHFFQQIVPVTFEMPDYGRVTVYVQVDGLVTPNLVSHQFRARIYRVTRQGSKIVIQRWSPILTGIFKTNGDSTSGEVNLPDDLLPLLPSYIETHEGLGGLSRPIYVYS